MAKPDHTIDARLLESAKAEFLANGFEKASLKTICENAAITTGALYKRYKGKEELFCAVVAGTVSDLNAYIDRKSAVDETQHTDRELIEAWNMGEDVMLAWFEFLYERREGFLLLISGAAGTRYQNFHHDWVETMTAKSYDYYREAFRRGLTRTEMSRTEVHILLTSFWSTVYEPFIHSYTWEEIETHSALVCRLLNWNRVLGFDE